MFKRKIFRYLPLLLVLLLAAGYYAYHEFNRRSSDTADLKPAYELSAIELIAGFQADEKEANAKYLGKVLLINGTIKSLDKDQAGLYTLIMGDSTSMSSVRCSMASKNATDPASFTIGARLSVKGICTGYTADDMGLGSDVILNRCVVTKSPNK